MRNSMALQNQLRALCERLARCAEIPSNGVALCRNPSNRSAILQRGWPAEKALAAEALIYAPETHSLNRRLKNIKNIIKIDKN
jgi:hypothetical protein